MLCYKSVPTNNNKRDAPRAVTGAEGAKRKRGVRASRVRLTRALAEAGLRSQAALAERIADLEGLEAAPKDVVSRVFRERPVEPRTLERVARALGVDAYSLYKTAREEALPAALPDDRVPATPTPPSRRRMTATAAALLMAVAASAWWFTRPPPERNIPVTVPVLRPLGLGTPSLVVLPIKGDTEGALTDVLRSELDDTFTVATASAAVLTRDLDPVSAATRLRTVPSLPMNCGRRGSCSAN